MGKLVMAQVKEDSRQSIIVAFGGRQYTRVDWRQVPAGAAKVEMASASPFLNFKSVKTAEPAPEPTGDLGDLSVKALKAKAKKLGLTGFSKLKQSALIDAILEVESAVTEKAKPKSEPDEPEADPKSEPGSEGD